VRRRTRALTTEERLIQSGLSVLVAAHPSEFLDLGAVEIAMIPRGGSIFPWRYRRQVQDAIGRAEEQLIDRHPLEWARILDYLEMRAQIQHLTPEDFA
jgi:hypothetical protein